MSPIAFEAVQKFDAIFALERSINGSSPEARVATRRKDIAPLVNDLIDWMKCERGKLSRHNEVAKAMDYKVEQEVAPGLGALAHAVGKADQLLLALGHQIAHRVDDFTKFHLTGTPAPTGLRR